MVVLCIMVILATVSVPLLHQQMAAHEIDRIGRLFILHAQFARQQALYLGDLVHIVPLRDHLWDQGWVVKNVCNAKQGKTSCIERNWISQGAISPVYFKGGGNQFLDLHSAKRGIIFNAAGAAKMGQGGFVANRLILGHHRAPKLERQLILSSGGRWRICDPSFDSKACQ